MTRHWLLSECAREWERDGATLSVPVFDVDGEEFLPPGDMPGRISAWLHAHGLPVPASRAELVRSLLHSLAEAYARSIRSASELSGREVSVVHLVGGGSQNALLCALGWVSGDLEALRALVVASFPVVRYQPRR